MAKKTSFKKSQKSRSSSNKIIPSSENEFIVWTFRNIDRDGKFAFDTSRKDFDLKNFVEKMIFYSNMTWNEITRQTHDNGKSKHHFLAENSLSNDAIERIKQKHFEDKTDSIFSFALNNKVRIIGFRDGAEFQVIWYDANHEFAISNKKHT